MPQEADLSSVGSDSQKVAGQIRDVNSMFSDKVQKELYPIPDRIKPVGIAKPGDGQKYQVELDKPKSIKLNGSFLNGNIKFNSLEVSNLSFNADQKTKTLSNIEGLSLNLTVFGSDRIMDVEALQLKVDKDGRKSLDAQIENPLSEPLQRIMGMPGTIKVEVPVHKGGIKVPRLSQVFSDASASTGPSIAGLLASDVLNEAAKVSLFVESNPEWVDNVVEPALNEIYKNLAKFTGEPEKPAVAQVGPTRPVRTQKTGTAKVGATGAARIQKAAFNPTTQPARIAPPKFAPPMIEPKIGDHRESVRIKGADRKYTVHVPPSYNDKTPMPLVIALHGHAQNGEIIAKETELNKLADKEGFIAVYPDARIWAGEEAWRAWDTDNGLLPPGEDADDVSFLRTIIENAEKDYKVDPKRIYLAGLSNGGMMSFRAAGDLSDKVAAIAVVSGAMSGNEPSPEHQISVLNIHGTSDKIVPYNGLKNVPASLTSIGLPKFKSMQYATDYWVGQNKITNPPLVLKHNGVVEKRYINDKTGTEVNEYTMINGRHVPPNFKEITNTVWNFFEAHPKNAGLASGIPQPKVEEPFNITERVKKHFATRGLKGVEKDVGQMINELHNLEDGSFSPGAVLKGFERKVDVTIDDPLAQLIKATDSVTKTGDKIKIDYDKPQKVDLGLHRSGPISVSALRLNDPSFRLTRENNLPKISRVKGVKFDLTAFGSDYSVKIKEASQKLDGNGDPYYRMGVSNPLPSAFQTVMFAKSTVPINLRLHESGTATVMNETEIKDATLGLNPVGRGYIDTGVHVGNLVDNPTWSSGLHVTKDTALIGGGTYLGWKLAAKRGFGRKGKIGAAVTLGLVVAPTVIHGIERLTD